ncbi:Phage protein [Lysobacter dokdonensis DS-58]|uniref:Phage protein n=1 Tax=Lysobacter dokdonensis DS-58 TaxID=1300345 RepID=A0A0A2WNQ9_9GAMM|nr:hypothetical protein [Lysobacter dokdonensis]KGQ19930.1 Phage protein [Lysobacter dokdonensis DS-58]
MSFDYSRTSATALGLLQRFGAAATLKRKTAGSYDPSTGTSAETVTSLATTACVFDYPQSYVDGTLILAGDKRAYLSSEQEPKQGDVLTWNAVDQTVIAVKAVAPAGVAVMYEAQLRG